MYITSEYMHIILEIFLFIRKEKDNLYKLMSKSHVFLLNTTFFFFNKLLCVEIIKLLK